MTRKTQPKQEYDPRDLTSYIGTTFVTANSEYTPVNRNIIMQMKKGVSVALKVRAFAGVNADHFNAYCHVRGTEKPSNTTQLIPVPLDERMEIRDYLKKYGRAPKKGLSLLMLFETGDPNDGIVTSLVESIKKLENRTQ